MNALKVLQLVLFVYFPFLLNYFPFSVKKGGTSCTGTFLCPVFLSVGGLDVDACFVA